MLNQDIQKYIGFIKGVNPLSKKKQHELCVFIKTSDDIKAIEKAKIQLIESNLKFVVKCATRFQNNFNETNIDILDLISEGNIGLMKAANEYDPFNESGANFTSFAFHLINHCIVKAIKDFRIIKFPRTYYGYNRKIKELVNKYGEDVSDDMICKELNIRQDTLDSCRKFIYTNYDYIDEIREKNDFIIPELTYSDASGFNKIDSEEFSNFIQKHIDKLPKKHKVVLSRLYMYGDQITLEKVAQTLGQSKQNIDSIKKRALAKLKKSLILDKSMGDYLDFKNNS